MTCSMYNCLTDRTEESEYNSEVGYRFLYNPLLAREVFDKLSPHIQSRWCDYAADHEGTADTEIVVLSRFLMREADRAVRYMYSPAASTAATTRREVRPAIMKKKANAVYTATENEQTDRCPHCGQPHALHRCPSYKALSVDQRWNMVREKGVCFRCVEKRHRRQFCKAKLYGVIQCRRPHHPTLHEEPSQHIAQPAAPPTTPPAVTPPNAPKHHETVLSLGTLPPKEKEVLLKVVPVTVTEPLGSVEIYALMGEGATITLIDEELAQRIGAEGPSTPLRLHGVNMTRQEHQSRTVSLQLKGTTQDKPMKNRARTAKHLRDIWEDVCYDLARPLLLIGSNNWELILTRELRVGGRNQPAASRTQLGWVVHGTVPRNAVYQRNNVLHVWTPDHPLHENQQHDDRLHELIGAHFRIDALGIAQRPRVGGADQRVIEIVRRTMKKVDGGYEVGLSWKTDGTTMPLSYEAALRRLRAIERRMNADPAFAEQHTAQMENLFNKGYAVPCDGTEQNSSVSWYLPHFAVQNPNKPGKQRLVFDAAHKNRGVSLNDQLLEGPDLLLSLQGILFRFREKPIAVTADIQEMFLQVKIRPDDQPAQQFLWRGENRTDPPRCFKMRNIMHIWRSQLPIHGSHSAQLQRNQARKDPSASISGNYSKPLHGRPGGQLRHGQFHAKALELKLNVLRDVPTELRATTPTALGTVERMEYKILGLYWNPQTDVLGFDTAMYRVPAEVRNQSRAPTKRETLSAVMSIYDPLGLLSHYTIRAKIILQNIWRLELVEEAELFASSLRQLDEIARLHLPRNYALENHEHTELHVFCDASEQAYAAVAYWRAALIGARLADIIRREHRIEIKKTIYWTDSSTVVHWVRNDARRYTPFVAHRLWEIAELTHKDEWRWLPTADNPADDATRQKREPHEDGEEVLHLSQQDESYFDWMPDPTRFSRFETLVRATANILAFTDICRKRATRMELQHIERTDRLLADY
ncbi:uncharacterized protein LOC113226290 [Hyposmocoma kahamanoa]|uniref:uncharacterized protein LOC113226290 n=1 Tax=Hyposmocoma kahamanoa TaxID=1477025 RepID=UPI000E6D9AB0|nr:uncharacterized protein LOC113226290 [Hyposmocoma kahamanoa]